MRFEEAAKMPEGTKFTIKEFENVEGYLYFDEGIVYSDSNIPQHASLDLVTATWEIFEKPKRNIEEFREELARINTAKSAEERLCILGEIYSQGYNEGLQAKDFEDC